jgi:hypothetical protein
MQTFASFLSYCCSLSTNLCIQEGPLVPVKRERSNFVTMRKLLLTILLWQIRSQRSSAFCREPHTLLLESLSNGNRLLQYRAIQDANEEFNSEGPEDTVRVRIWRTLVEENGRELSLTVLSSILGDRRSDVRHHLTHVEKQCKSLQSKSEAWRLRRGLPLSNTMKMSITTRRGGGKRNELYIKLH